MFKPGITQHNANCVSSKDICIDLLQTTDIPRPRRLGATNMLAISRKKNIEIFSFSLEEIDIRLAELGKII